MLFIHLFVGTCHMPHVTCDVLSHVSQGVLPVGWQISLWTYHMSYVTCHMSHVRSSMSHVVSPPISPQVCRLSGDDSVSAGLPSVSSRPGALYYQRPPCVDRMSPITTSYLWTSVFDHTVHLLALFTGHYVDHMWPRSQPPCLVISLWPHVSHNNLLS